MAIPSRENVYVFKKPPRPSIHSDVTRSPSFSKVPLGDMYLQLSRHFKTMIDAFGGGIWGRNIKDLSQRTDDEKASPFYDHHMTAAQAIWWSLYK